MNGSEETLVVTGQAMDAPVLRPFAGGTVAVYSRGRPGAPTGNEDGAAVVPTRPGRGVLAIADGAGGHAAGAVAAETALRVVTDSVRRAARERSPVRAAILDGIETANARVDEVADGAATTLAVVEIDGTMGRSYHVGDSEILVVGQRGKIRLQVVPHSPTGYAVEAGYLGEAEALDHEDRHLVSNVVGSPDMRIEIGSAVVLRPRDTVLLATDGLVDNLEAREIVEIVRKGPLLGAAEQLASLTHRRMTAPAPGEPSKVDDVTFLLFRRPPPQRGGAQPVVPAGVPA